MKQLILVLVMASVLSAFSPVCGFSKAAADRVVIDFEMVRAGIDWLELVKSGAPEDEIKTAFMEKVAPTAGCQAIVMHWARFMEWDAGKLYDFIMEALAPNPDPEKLRNEDGSPSFFAMRHRLWQSALDDLPGMRRDLELLKKADLLRSVAIARRFLPAEAELDVRFSFVLFGHSTAFSVGRENGFDFLQLPRLADGALDLDRIGLTFAHELHHSGFAQPAVAQPQRLQLLGVLAAEGMPTYFIDEIDRRLPELKRIPDETARLMAAEWERHTADLPALYERAAADLLANFEQRIGQEEIMEFWMAGLKGPAYVLGADMIATIDRYLGRDEAVSIAADYRKCISLYNRAARKANEMGAEKFIFPQELQRRLAGLFE